MFRPIPFNLFFPVLFPFWLGGGFMAQLSKVLKVVCWGLNYDASSHSIAHDTSSLIAQLRAQRQQHSVSSTAPWSDEHGVAASFPYPQPKLHVQHAATATSGGHQLQGANQELHRQLQGAGKQQIARTTQRAAREPLQPVQKSSDGVVSIVW